jgi:predicted DNA-binding transcriptional regulator AlpA
MSDLTGISRNTLYRAIRDTRNYLQDEIQESRFRR